MSSATDDAVGVLADIDSLSPQDAFYEGLRIGLMLARETKLKRVAVVFERMTAEETFALITSPRLDRRRWTDRRLGHIEV